MKNVWLRNASSTPPVKPASLEIGYPSDNGPATVPGAWWYHMVSSELLNTISDAGLTYNDSTLTQLRDAIAIIAKKSVSSGSGIPVRLVDTVGVGLTNAQVVDGVATQTGDRILRSVAPAASTNGVYEANSSGAWTRVADLPVGGTMMEGLLFSVAEGTNQKGTVWQMADISGTTATIGTTAILFRNITDSLDAKFSQYLLAASAAATYAPITSPTFNGSVTLNAGAAGSVPYLNGSKAVTTDANLTFDGVNLAASGRVSGASITPTGVVAPTAGMYLPAANTLAWSTNSQRALSINPQGYVAVGTVSGIYQAQVTGQAQGSASLADGGAVGGSLLLQDSNSAAGAGGALVFGTALGAASPFAAIKGLLSDTSTGKVGHLGFGVRSLVGDASLTEAMRLTSTRNLLIGTTNDTLASSNGNVVLTGKLYGAQVIGTLAGVGGQVQAIGGSSTTWYNAMLRNDGTTAQLLSTSAGTSAVGVIDNAANVFRPFSWNLTTGAVTIDGTGVGVSFGGSASGVTPGAGDNSTKFATTAWINTKLGAYAPATGAAAFLRSNGTGGFENYTIGSGLAYDSVGKVLSVNVSGALGGTVTSVDMTVPAFLTVSGGPITGAGTFAVTLSGSALPIANGGTGATTATGTGSNVLANSPILITPNLGTPSAAVLTNATGLSLTTGVTGQLGVANGGTGTTTSTGTGSNVLSNSPVLTTPNLGTPSVLTLTNATGLPLASGVTGTLAVTQGGTGLATMAAGGALYTTSLNTLAVGTLPVTAGGTGVTASTGAGSIVLNNSPALIAPILGTPASVNLANATNVPASQLTGTLPIAAFASGVNASVTTFWRGDGAWATPGGGGTVGNVGNLTANSIVLGTGTTGVTTTALITTDGVSKIGLGSAASTTGGAIIFGNSTANGGTMTLQPDAGNLGVSVMTLQAGNDTLVGRSTTDTLSNKTISGASNSLTNVSLTTAVTGVLPVVNGGTGSSTATGSGANVLANSPVLTTPNLGIPVAGNLANCTGLTIAGVTGMGTGVSSFLVTPTSANLALAVSDETGSGSLVFSNSPVLTTPNLGTPSAAVLTNATGLPITTGVSGLASGVAAFLATPSSANLFTALTTKSGTGGNVVFANGATLVSPNLGTPIAGSLVNCNGLPLSGGAGVSGVLPILNGGTGSTTQTWVDLSNNQGIAGQKWFASQTGFGAMNPNTSNNWSLYSFGRQGHPALVGEAWGVGSSCLTAIQGSSAASGASLILFHYGQVSTGYSGVGSITTDGASIYMNTTSDYRLKENVVPMADSVARLKLLKPVNYTWKDKADLGEQEGFIAHELQEVVPMAVHGEKDAVNEDGTIKMQSIDPSKVIPLLTSALQEAFVMIEALKQEMADLKASLGG